jgi:hypothetical protein
MKKILLETDREWNPDDRAAIAAREKSQVADEASANPGHNINNTKHCRNVLEIILPGN